MTADRALTPHASSALVVRAQGSDRSLPAGPAYRIGRDPDADIVVNDPRVSWQHAMLQFDGSAWVLQDSGSTNGTFLGAERVSRVPVGGGCTVRLGHPSDGPAMSLSLAQAPAAGRGSTALASSPAGAAAGAAMAAAVAPPAPPAPPPHSPGRPASPGGYEDPGGSRSRSGSLRPPSAVMRLPVKVLRIGRATDNDVIVADLGVSRYHSELRRGVSGYEIVDLGSHNGTFVNGQRVSAAPVSEMDIIGIGPATFRLVGEELQEFIDTGDVSLQARDLTVTLPSGKVILNHVSFPLGERCLLGVIGPSGAGKSTLLGALTGMRPATTGGVTYDDRDLYTHYDELRHRIGLVPQENILHTQLSARRALGYAAELRFPKDVSKGERQRRIDEVLAELSLTPHAETKTSSLSGGQQKRVNVALELLTKPSLLFLDEPTSGLDPGLDKSVMEMMADLAHDGRTVIVVTHSVANLNLCDRLLVLVPGGKIAYFGPPEDGLKHFGKPGWAEVFQAFDAEPNRDWQAEFRNSKYHERYVTAEMDGGVPAGRRGGASPAAPAPAKRNRLSQLSTLCRRYMAVIASDRVYLAVLGILPIVLGGLIRVVPAPLGLGGTNNQGASSLLLILVISACFTGAANAVRELVKERPIYSRERAAGLSAGVYLFSKLIILGAVSALQAIALLLIGLTGRGLPGTGSSLKHLPLVELMVGMGLLAIASMTLGLFISAAVNTSEKTMPLLVISVMFQVILTGGVFGLNGKAGINQISWLAPARWGYAATASTSNLNVIQLPPVPKVPQPSETPGAGKNKDKKNGAGKGKNTPSASAAPGGAAPPAGSTPSATPSGGTTPSTTPSTTPTATPTATPTVTPSGVTATPSASVSPAAQAQVLAEHSPKPKKKGAKASPSASPSGSTTPPATPSASDAASGLISDPLWDHKSGTWVKDMAAMVLLSLLFTSLAWWRLLKLSPGRRK
jgi:ABC transport system ATP-binding/permease protein